MIEFNPICGAVLPFKINQGDAILDDVISSDSYDYSIDDLEGNIPLSNLLEAVTLIEESSFVESLNIPINAFSESYEGKFSLPGLKIFKSFNCYVYFSNGYTSTMYEINFGHLLDQYFSDCGSDVASRINKLKTDIGKFHFCPRLRFN